MDLQFTSIEYHGNGENGTPFHAVLFCDLDYGNMLGVVFDHPGQVAVFNVGQLANGSIAYGVNTWNGDVYEPYLRTAVENYKQTHYPIDRDKNGVNDVWLIQNSERKELAGIFFWDEYDNKAEFHESRALAEMLAGRPELLRVMIELSRDFEEGPNWFPEEGFDLAVQAEAILQERKRLLTIVSLHALSDGRAA
jgi:hypothetical protein